MDIKSIVSKFHKSAILHLINKFNKEFPSVDDFFIEFILAGGIYKDDPEIQQNLIEVLTNIIWPDKIEPVKPDGIYPIGITTTIIRELKLSGGKKLPKLNILMPAELPVNNNDLYKTGNEKIQKFDVLNDPIHLVYLMAIQQGFNVDTNTNKILFSQKKWKEEFFPFLLLKSECNRFPIMPLSKLTSENVVIYLEKGTNREYLLHNLINTKDPDWIAYNKSPSYTILRKIFARLYKNCRPCNV